MNTADQLKRIKELLGAVTGFEDDDQQYVDDARDAVQKLIEALAEQPAQQDSTCSNALRIQHKPYPRTCKKCGLGPCVELAQQALDKMAENARELGLDYEPAQQELKTAETVGYSIGFGDGYQAGKDAAPQPTQQEYERGFIDGMQEQMKRSVDRAVNAMAQRTWVGLTDEEYREAEKAVWAVISLDDTEKEANREFYEAIEAKLKEKNT